MDNDESKGVREWDRVILRMPDGMKWMLKERAVRNRRALNGELLLLIESGLAAEKAASGQN